MGDRTRQITVYVDADLDREIEQRAEEADVSKSQFVMETLETYVKEDLEWRVSREAGVERRLEELVAHATESVDDAIEGFRAENDLLAAAVIQTAIYSRAIWELVKEDYGDLERRQAIQTATEAVETEAEKLGIEVHALGTPYDHETGRIVSESRSVNGPDSDWDY